MYNRAYCTMKESLAWRPARPTVFLRSFGEFSKLNHFQHALIIHEAHNQERFVLIGSGRATLHQKLRTGL